MKSQIEDMTDGFLAKWREANAGTPLVMPPPPINSKKGISPDQVKNVQIKL